MWLFKKFFRQFDNQNGQIFILAFIVLTLIIINVVILASRSLTAFQSSKYSLTTVQSINLAEAGIDKAAASLNSTGGLYNGESETSLGDGSYSVTVTSIDPANKIIEATGYIPNKTDPKYTKTIKIQVSKGVGVAFNYGVQVGNGGLTMSNNSRVNGSVYSNGSISLSNGARINGDAYVAGGVQPNPDQENDCTGINCADFIFGRTSGQEVDAAQSFRPNTSPLSSQSIDRITLKLAKVGSPSNLTVKILGDSGNKPNRSDVKASGIVYANLVTSSYDFVDVTYTTNPPVLNNDVTYWIVLDVATANTSNYWKWSKDTLQTYTRGTGKWSPNYNVSNPAWNDLSPLGDLGFKTYKGGIATSIIGSSSNIISGSAHAHTLGNLAVSGNAYYQLISPSGSVTAANLYPASTDPVAQPLPISDGNILQWKNEAEAGGTQVGDVSGCPATMLKKHYIGNINLTNGCISTMDSPIWITGNLELDNNSILKLNSSFGTSSGVIVVDGTIELSNNGKLQGSGTTGSYLMGLSTFDSTSTDNTAIEADNGSTSSLLYAGKGKIIIKNNATLQEITGWKISLDNGSTINYQSGLSGLFFSSGPSGSFAAVKGSYQLK